MKYVEPLNSASYPEREGSYVNANPATGVKGSTVPGEALEHPQREILNVIEAAGLTPNGADLTQLLQAINSLWFAETASVTRTGDTTITLQGDQTAAYPRGKRLRFNGSDDYLCRVYGVPTYSDGVTTITVWFDFGLPDRTIPATVTKLERRPLRPEETGETIPLMTTTYSAEVFQELILSRCIGGGSVRKGA